MRYLKIVLSIILGLGVALLSTYAWFARDIAATHTALSQSKLPPLIPVRDFFANSDSKWDYKLSDSGKWLSWREVRGASTLVKYRLVDGSETYELHPTGRFTLTFNDSAKAFYIVDRKGVWLVDPAKPTARWKKIDFAGIRRWRILSFPTAKSPSWIVSSFDHNEAAPDIFRYDVNGNNRKMVVDNDGSVFRWNFTQQGKISLRYRRLDTGGTSLEIPEGKKWRELLRVDADDKFFVAGSPELDQKFWALSNRGRDKLVAVSVNPRTGEENVLYENEKVDVDRFLIDTETNKPKYVFVKDPYLRAVSFDEHYVKLFSLLSKTERKTFNILSETNDGNGMTIALSENEDAFRYYLIDVQKGTRQKLGTYVFAKYDTSLSETKPVTITASDGVEIPALLTKPKGAKNAPLPLVLLVHGGPSMRDFLGYNHKVQFLSNRGYAVLRVNYRGSIGYGRKFQALGFGGVGTRIHDDLDDAVKWAVEQGVADPSNVAIMGTSYGGYSALTGAWKGSGLYKAAVAYAAVSDMEDQTKNPPKFWALHMRTWTQYVGDPYDPAVQKNLRKVSPINHIDSFNIPLLLIHGTNDGVVKVQQSQKLQKKLEAAGKEVKTVYIDGEGHGLTRWQNRVKFWRHVEQFLAQHLGGRDGGLDYVEAGELIK